MASKIFSDKEIKKHGKQIADNIEIGSAVYEAMKEYFGGEDLSHGDYSQIWNVVLKEIKKEITSQTK